MNKDDIRNLFGFITSRKINQKNDMYDEWLKYHRKRIGNNMAGQQQLMF